MSLIEKDRVNAQYRRAASGDRSGKLGAGGPLTAGQCVIIAGEEAILGSDFETRRAEEEAARRARTATRDAERRTALAAGARASSRADGTDSGGTIRVAAIGAAALAAGALVLGLITFGSPVAAVGLGGAAVFGATSFALFRFGSKDRSRREAADARLASIAAGTLSSAPTHEQAVRRARAAVEAAEDLDAARRKAILRALDAARAEVGAGADVERTAAFVARCDAIVASLETLPRSSDASPSALSHLDGLAADLAQEATARAEVEEALQVARSAAQRQPES